jgi:hypothetical protein
MTDDRALWSLFGIPEQFNRTAGDLLRQNAGLVLIWEAGR